MAHLVGTRRTAVAVAAITVATDDDRSAATSAEIASSRKIHWHIGPMGSPPERPLCGILRVQRRPSGLRGAASELAWRLVPVSRQHLHRPASVLPYRQRYRQTVNAKRADVVRTFRFVQVGACRFVALIPAALRLPDDVCCAIRPPKALWALSNPIEIRLIKNYTTLTNLNARFVRFFSTAKKFSKPFQKMAKSLRIHDLTPFTGNIFRIVQIQHNFGT